MGSEVAVVTFPGSNGDHDAYHAFSHDLGVPTRMVDYRETDLSGIGAVILPGGFSYGDALRCGAIARFAPVVESIRTFAERGGPVLGICNGFQVLTEAHLLPGALLRNTSLRFHCQRVCIRTEQADTSWTATLRPGEVLQIPIAHGDGAFFADRETLDRLEGNGQVVFRYCDPAGSVTPQANPNGAERNIAGIANAGGNVVGLMPHPERATDPLIGPADGLTMLRSVFDLLAVPV